MVATPAVERTEEGVPTSEVNSGPHRGTFSGCVFTGAQVHRERLAPSPLSSMGSSRRCLCHGTLKTRIHQALLVNQYQSIFPSKSREQIARQSLEADAGGALQPALKLQMAGLPFTAASPSPSSCRQTQTLHSLSTTECQTCVGRLHH